MKSKIRHFLIIWSAILFFLFIAAPPAYRPKHQAQNIFVFHDTDIHPVYMLEDTGCHRQNLVSYGLMDTGMKKVHGFLVG